MSNLTTEPADLWILVYWDFLHERVRTVHVETFEELVDLMQTIPAEEGKYSICRGFPVDIAVEHGSQVRLGTGEAVFFKKPVDSDVTENT